MSLCGFLVLEVVFPKLNSPYSLLSVSVTEFMSNGSLDHLLRGKDARGEELGWPRIVDMLRGISAGMKYLTDKGYVHRVSCSVLLG